MPDETGRAHTALQPGYNSIGKLALFARTVCLKLNRWNHDGDDGRPATRRLRLTATDALHRHGLLSDALVRTFDYAVTRCVEFESIKRSHARLSRRRNGSKPGKDYKQGQNALQHRAVR